MVFFNFPPILISRLKVLPEESSNFSKEPRQ